MTPHLKCKVVVSCSIHHVADLGEAKTFYCVCVWRSADQWPKWFNYCWVARKMNATKVELTNPFSATYEGSPLTRAQWSAGGPLRVWREWVTADWQFQNANEAVSSRWMLCDSASPYLRDNFDLLFAFQQIVNNLVEADFLKVLNIKLRFLIVLKTWQLNWIIMSIICWTYSAIRRLGAFVCLLFS